MASLDALETGTQTPTSKKGRRKAASSGGV